MLSPLILSLQDSEAYLWRRKGSEKRAGAGAHQAPTPISRTRHGGDRGGGGGEIIGTPVAFLLSSQKRGIYRHRCLWMREQPLGFLCSRETEAEVERNPPSLTGLSLSLPLKLQLPPFTLHPSPFTHLPVIRNPFSSWK